VPARRFVEVPDADDVGLEDRRERPLGRDAAEVDDRLAAGDDPVDRAGVMERRGHDLLAGAGGCHLGDVAEAQRPREPAQARPQLAAEAAGGAGQEQAVEHRTIDGVAGRGGERCGHDAMLGAVVAPRHRRKHACGHAVGRHTTDRLRAARTESYDNPAPHSAAAMRRSR